LYPLGCREYGHCAWENQTSGKIEVFNFTEDDLALSEADNSDTASAIIAITWRTASMPDE
jgi:hypothetical protein